MNNLDPHDSNIEMSEEFSLLYKVIKAGGREKLRRKLKLLESNYSGIRLEKDITKSKHSGIKERLGEIFSDYFFPFENLITVRSEKSKDKQFQEAMTLYSFKQYTEAIKILKKCLKEKPGDQMISFYLSISLLASGKYATASRLLNAISKDEHSLLSEPATWYLALARTGDLKFDEAKKIFSQFEKKSIYHRKALRIIKRLSQ